MRTMRVNKQTIYYSLLASKEDIYDEYGNLTGEQKLIYGEPIALDVNVSAARGTADVEQFGINANYTKTIVAEVDCPINETARLWIGKLPTEKHNYVVKSVARSINSVTYAVKEVVVS